MDDESSQKNIVKSDVNIEILKKHLARLEEFEAKSFSKREIHGSYNVGITAMFLLVLGGLLIAVGYLVSPQTHGQMISEALKVIGFGVSVFAVTSYLQTKRASNASQLQLEEAKSEIQSLSEQVREAITEKLENTRGAIEKLTEKNLNDIKERITELQNFEIIRERPDVSNLNKVIFKYVSDWIEKIRVARIEKRIILEEDYVALFPYVFKRTLELYPNASFVATSLARESYL